MHIKVVVGVLIISLFIAVSSYAKPKQAAPQGPLTADDIVAKMTKQLELTDLQVVEVKPIIEEYLTEEKQLKFDEKKELSKVLTGQQLYSWNFLQNEEVQEKKKRSSF